MTETVSGQGGKGDQPRRIQIPREVFNLRRDLALGTPEEKAEARKKLIEMGVIEE